MFGSVSLPFLSFPFTRLTFLYSFALHYSYIRFAYLSSILLCLCVLLCLTLRQSLSLFSLIICYPRDDQPPCRSYSCQCFVWSIALRRISGCHTHYLLPLLYHRGWQLSTCIRKRRSTRNKQVCSERQSKNEVTNVVSQPLISTVLYRGRQLSQLRKAASCHHGCRLICIHRHVLTTRKCNMLVMRHMDDLYTHCQRRWKEGKSNKHCCTYLKIFRAWAL